MKILLTEILLKAIRFLVSPINCLIDRLAKYTKPEYPIARSIESGDYSEIIEILEPVRFYWNEDGTFDGIEFGELHRNPYEWETDMINQCLEAIIPAMGVPKSTSNPEKT